jgi:hypothetical protein
MILDGLRHISSVASVLKQSFSKIRGGKPLCMLNPSATDMPLSWSSKGVGGKEIQWSFAQRVEKKHALQFSNAVGAAISGRPASEEHPRIDC